MSRSSLNEKREEDGVYLNQEQKRLDNIILVNNNNHNKNDDDSDTEVIYASGDWHNLTP